MTLEEVKQTHRLDEAVRDYGIRIGPSGKICCPFHPGDRRASLRIYQDHFHCYGCGAHGDVVDFVARMEGVDFKTAFIQLGGTYDEDPEEARKVLEDAEIRRRVKGLKTRAEGSELSDVVTEITRLRSLPDADEPFSDTWCKLQEQYMKLRRIEDERSGF